MPPNRPRALLAAILPLLALGLPFPGPRGPDREALDDEERARKEALQKRLADRLGSRIEDGPRFNTEEERASMMRDVQDALRANLPEIPDPEILDLTVSPDGTMTYTVDLGSLDPVTRAHVLERMEGLGPVSVSARKEGPLVVLDLETRALAREPSFDRTVDHRGLVLPIVEAPTPYHHLRDPFGPYTEADFFGPNRRPMPAPPSAGLDTTRIEKALDKRARKAALRLAEQKRSGR